MAKLFTMLLLACLACLASCSPEASFATDLASSDDTTLESSSSGRRELMGTDDAVTVDLESLDRRNLLGYGHHGYYKPRHHYKPKHHKVCTYRRMHTAGAHNIMNKRIKELGNMPG